MSDWYPFKEVADALDAREWFWSMTKGAAKLKYIEFTIRVDTRDNDCIVTVKDREGKKLCETKDQFMALMSKLDNNTPGAPERGEAAVMGFTPAKEQAFTSAIEKLLDRIDKLEATQKVLVEALETCRNLTQFDDEGDPHSGWFEVRLSRVRSVAREALEKAR